MQDTVRKLNMYDVNVEMKGSKMGRRKMKLDHSSSSKCFCQVFNMPVRFCKYKSAAAVQKAVTQLRGCEVEK